MDQSDIDRHRSAAKNSRHFRKKHRSIVGTTPVDGIPGVLPDEQAVGAKMFFRANGRIGGIPLGMEMYDFDTAKLCRTRHQCVDELRWSGCGALNEDPRAGMHACYGFFGAARSLVG